MHHAQPLPDHGGSSMIQALATLQISVICKKMNQPEGWSIESSVMYYFT